jgi:AcrR family transcriptional regulator
MPRLADHDQRRSVIVEALGRVIAEQGPDAISVRAVAAEAGMSPTALRHYFPTQDALLEHAMQAVVDRVVDRLRPALDTPSGQVVVETVLVELLPLDEARRAEQLTFLALVSRARTAPALRTVRDEADARLGAVMRRVVETLAARGQLHPARDHDDEALRLHALLDGLAFQGVLSDERHPPAALRAVLHHHLLDLATPPVTDPCPRHE